jgi:hypothetical protein
MKYLGHTLETYVYSHCNICNIPIYFCNIDKKHLQHTSETHETFEAYVWNMCFQRNISLLLRRMKARWCVDNDVELSGNTELVAEHRGQCGGGTGGGDDAKGSR